MNKPSFYLKDPKAKKTTSIKLVYYADDGPLNYYTGESLPPSLWDPVTQSATHKGVKAVLDRITTTIDKMVTEYKVMEKPLTKEAIRQRLDKLLNKEPAKKVTVGNAAAAFETAIREMREGKIRTQQENIYGAGTIRTIEQAKITLQEFEPNMSLDEIDMDTYNRFIIFCYSKDHSRNYTGTLIKNWKTLLRVTYDRFHKNNIYDTKSFKQIWEDVEDIALTEEEKAVIYSADLSKNPRQELVRDWFIVGCYLGLRVNDLVGLGEKNRTKNEIQVVNEKTGAKVVIPIHPVVKEVLKKYKGFPPGITDVEINRVIKEICRDLKIDSPVIYSMTKGGKKINYYFKKWELISTHTMRRTLVTNLTKAKMEDPFIMKIAGITSYATLKRYQKMTSSEAAQIAAEHPYFKG